MSETKEVIDQLERIGHFKRVEASDNQQEVLRIIDESYIFREYSEVNGMPKRVGYERVKDFYKQYGCRVGWKYYMRLFPIIDELLVSQIVKNAGK